MNAGYFRMTAGAGSWANREGQPYILQGWSAKHVGPTVRSASWDVGTLLEVGLEQAQVFADFA